MTSSRSYYCLLVLIVDYCCCWLLQAAWWGHPVTAGLPTIDYFFGLDEELVNAHEEYSEQLVRMSVMHSAPLVQVRGTTQHNTSQHNTSQHNTTQQHKTTQHNTT